ncbi:hypothetical protein H5410_014534 [Solanum commersonii]|uniref:Uncharacterized protein n=1 Tax=Solanum commersonii TaxID=4109 RepID=A0A9J5ZR88_SOLCO|nr:hypothetical protein H5410_014534 [Solanum commersonii]
MTNKDEFNATANIIVPIENLESSRSIADIQNKEKMSHIDQKLEILREELRQTPIYFPKANLPSADLPNQPELNQHTPTYDRVPPASPTAVRIVPDLSNRDPTIPTMQQILGAPIAAPYEPHVPPIYTTGVLTLTTPAVVNVPYEVDQYAEMEVDAWLKDDASINAQFHGLKKASKSLQTSYVTYQVYNTQPHYNPSRAPTYQNTPRPYISVQAPIHQNRPAYALKPHPNLKARNARAYTLIAEPYAQLFERLRTAGVLQPVEGKLPDPIPRNFDGNKRCAYHSGIQGHDTKDCYGLKNQIESLIRRGVIKCTPAPPNVNNNPLPNHENREVNIVTPNDEYGSPDYPNIDEADDMTSLAQPVITVQLREPLTVQTYLPRVVVTALIVRKSEYDTKAVTIHGELCHPIHSANSIPVTNEFDGDTFHTFEIIQVVRLNEEAKPEDTKLSSTVKMVASEMLKYRYQSKSGLEPKSNGIGASDTIFVPKKTLIPDQAGDDDIIKGVGNLLMAMDDEEEEINLNKLTIRDAEPREILQN